ncbi:MAG: 50S ribosomal protein L13 [Candidatus Aenigmatarchaeota archaeon]
MAEVRFGSEIVDAEGTVLGRLASVLAKRLLMGEDITVVNAERAVISGAPAVIKKRFFDKRARGDRIKGPFYPRYPDALIKRAVRGMLPYKKEKGSDALKRLKVYMGTPEQFKGKAHKTAKQTANLSCKYMTLGQLCESLGAKKERWS